MRKRRRRDDRRIGDVDAVVNFVALLQAAQDRDRVFDRRLVHQHFLEATLQRGVLLDVLAIFVERGRADAMQLAARQRRLEHVAGVHRAFGLAGADHRVQLVDEQDDLAFLLRQIVEHGLEALFEFAAILRAGDQRAHVERQNALAAQAFGHFAIDDALRETFDDRGLADAGLADQHRIVLGATLQHLHGAANLVVATDDRIELALLGALGQIDGVLLQRLPAFLRVRIGHLLAAAHLVDGLLDRALHGAGIAQNRAELALVLERRQHEQLAGDVLIAALLRELVGELKQPVQLVGDVHFAAALPSTLRQAVERLAELRAQQIDVGAGLVEQVAHRAALLVQQGRHARAAARCTDDRGRPPATGRRPAPAGICWSVCPCAWRWDRGYGLRARERPEVRAVRFTTILGCQVGQFNTRVTLTAARDLFGLPSPVARSPLPVPWP